jgi:hypothetical protein
MKRSDVIPYGLIFVLLLLSLSCSSLTGVDANRTTGTAGPASGGGDGSAADASGQGSGAAVGDESDEGLDISLPNESVPYGIYVGARVQGKCGPYTNSGSFQSMTFDSEFHHVIFYRPSETELPGPMGGMQSANSPMTVGMAGVSIDGKGQLGDYSFCPMYETEEDAYDCTVVEGPRPFVPAIQLMPMEPDMFPNVPLVGTPGPLGGGTSIILFSLDSAATSDPIMKWDGKIGVNLLGGASDPVQAPFPVTWDQLMMNEGFSVDIITGDEGETWEWTMRFIPEA